MNGRQLRDVGNNPSAVLSCAVATHGVAGRKNEGIRMRVFCGALLHSEGTAVDGLRVEALKRKQANLTCRIRT